MHVLIISHRFFPRYHGGTEVLSLQLARGLQTRGYQVTVLTGEPNEGLSCDAPPWLSADTHEGLATHRLHYGTVEQSWARHGMWKKLVVTARMLNGSFDPIASHVSAPERIAVVRDLVACLKPDLVHINHVIGFSAAIIPEMRRLGIPVVFTPTDYFAVCPKYQLYRKFDRSPCDGPGNAIDCVRCMQPMPRWVACLAMGAGLSAPARMAGVAGVFRSLTHRPSLMIKAINSANKILPSTRFLADVLIRHGVDRTLVEVVPYGIDIGELPPMRPVPTRFDRQSPLRLGFIGTLVETKGAHVVMEALSLLGERENEVLFSIYGKTDVTDRYCLSLIQSAEALGTSVRFAGTFPPEKMGEILRNLDVLAVPSLWYESIPLVLRSAFNAGTPVLISRMGGLTEPLKDSGCVQSFPAGDARALSGLILRLLDDPQALGRLRACLTGEVRRLADYLDDVETEYRAIV